MGNSQLAIRIAVLCHEVISCFKFWVPKLECVTVCQDANSCKWADWQCLPGFPRCR